MLINTRNEKELIACGCKFGKTLTSGTVVVLNGPLGAGKTTFVKGIAKALDINEPITSPTYTISRLYSEKLCHVDSYRISNEDIGLDDLQSQGYIICIEWAENITDYLPDVDYQVDIEYTEFGRQVEIKEISEKSNITNV